MYSYGLLHIAEQKQGDQLEPTYSSSVRIQGVALRTSRKRWTMGRGGEKVSGTSVLMARQDDDDDDHTIYQPLRSGRIWHKVNFKRSLTGLNPEFSFSQTSCLTKAEEPSLSYYLPIAGGRIIGFIPFPRVLVLCEMQSVSSRNWTRIAVFISYGDNDYTTGTSTMMMMMITFTFEEIPLGKLWSSVSFSQLSV